MMTIFWIKFIESYLLIKLVFLPKRLFVKTTKCIFEIQIKTYVLNNDIETYFFLLISFNI